MPPPHMDIRMIKDVLRLKLHGGLSHEAIARSLSISKGAVAKYVSLAAAAALDWDEVAGLGEAELERRLLGRGAELSKVIEPDFGRVHLELRRFRSISPRCAPRPTALPRLAPWSRARRAPRSSVASLFR